MSKPLIEVRDLRKSFPVTRGLLVRRVIDRMVAVDGVTFDVQEGETLGCVGGSGSGKSTLGRLIMRLLEPDSGEVRFEGQSITHLSAKKMRPLRRQMQIVFQDPLQCLNPRRTVTENVERPLLNFGESRAHARERVAEMLALVGIDPRHAHRYPHEYSGGQCQRIAIARALTLEPRFLFLDEPVSALDVSIQAQILQLLESLQHKLGLTYLFVSHDLKLVKQFCDRTAVMYRGRLLEIGHSTEIYYHPRHPFTRDFLGTVLHMRKDSRWEAAAERAQDLEESAKHFTDMVPGGDACIYSDTCAEQFDLCTRRAPAPFEQSDGRRVACHLYDPRLAGGRERVAHS